MIVGRSGELARLDDLLAALCYGEGTALVVHGEAGIGKTTLLDALAERAGDRVTLLRVCAAEMEAQLAFAVLADLLQPLADELETLPAPQAAALAGALALGPPVRGDRLAVCVATLGVLRAAACRRPVLVLLDDAQWADAASRECVEYVARRAGGHLAVVLAARDPWCAPERLRLPALTVGPVDAAGAAELLRRRAPGLAPPVAAAIVEAAAGNPLALVELPATLPADQRAGIAPLDLPLAPDGRLRLAFAGRLAALSPPARRALLVAAAHAGDDLPTIAAASQRVGVDVAELAGAEASGLVRLGAGRVVFAHPLVRGSVYRDASAADRRAAHAALACVQAGERRAWHLAAAAVGPDEQVAAELERVGNEAAARRAYPAAATALERAAALTGDPAATSRRLLAAGRAASAAGLADRALALLERAVEAAVDLEQRALAEHARGRMLIWRGLPDEATRVLVREARRVERSLPALAAVLLADAANSATTTNRHREAERLALRAVDLAGAGADADRSLRASVLTMLGWVLTLRGHTPRARPVLDEAALLSAGLDGLGPHWPWLHLQLRARVPLGEFEQARDESTALAALAREAGALATLSGAQLVAADVAFRIGDWDAADALTVEAIRLAADTGQPPMAGLALTARARLTAARGLNEESQEAAREGLGIAHTQGMTTGLRFAHAALGFNHLCQDRVDEAIAELEYVERLVVGTGLEEPTIVPWAPDLIEAYARRGDEAAARRVLRTLARQAAATGTAVAAAAAARCRGLLDQDFDAAFTLALAEDDRRPMPFERARTLLAYGRRLHRTRRRAEARGRLREALAGFERLRAAAWTAQAERELRAAGARRSRQGPADGTLTNQERRVAEAVRRGASNREIAAELFLSPKTIEFHLRQIYAKLNVHSRTQLVAALAERPPRLATSDSPGAPTAPEAIASAAMDPRSPRPFVTTAGH
jgi:DNA-binding CsgD family transcriptional regulator